MEHNLFHRKKDDGRHTAVVLGILCWKTNEVDNLDISLVRRSDESLVRNLRRRGVGSRVSLES